MVKEFFYAISYSCGMNLHIKVLTGGNSHHMAEAMFKSFAKHWIRQLLLTRGSQMYFPPREVCKAEDDLMSKKLLIPCLYLQAGRAVTGFGQRNLFGDGDVEKLARFYSDNGADELLVFDFSSGDEEHEHAIARIKEICAASEVPVMAAGNINRAEDVKKLIYAGCAKVVLNLPKTAMWNFSEKCPDVLGREKMLVCISSSEEYNDHREQIH